ATAKSRRSSGSPKARSKSTFTPSSKSSASRTAPSLRSGPTSSSPKAICATEAPSSQRVRNLLVLAARPDADERPALHLVLEERRAISVLDCPAVHTGLPFARARTGLVPSVDLGLAGQPIVTGAQRGVGQDQSQQHDGHLGFS